MEELFQICMFALAEEHVSRRCCFLSEAMELRGAVSRWESVLGAHSSAWSSRVMLGSGEGLGGEGVPGGGG